MGSQLKTLAGTLANNAAVGTEDWVDPTNAASTNNTYASVQLFAVEESKYLLLTNWGFTIPANPVGYILRVEKKQQPVDGDITDSSIRLWTGSAVGSNKATGTSWPGSDTVVTYGTSTDLWGASLTSTNVNDASFGIAISCHEIVNGESTAQIDHVTLEVFYADPVTGAICSQVSCSGQGMALVMGVGSISAQALCYGQGSQGITGVGTISCGVIVSGEGLHGMMGIGSIITGASLAGDGQAGIIGIGAAVIGGATVSGFGQGTAPITASCHGRYRIQNNAAAGYTVYVGEDALPDLNLAPTAFSTTLPVNVAITPPGVGTKTLYVVARKRNSYGLESGNQYPEVFKIDTVGNLVRNTPPTPSGVEAVSIGFDKIRVLAAYPSLTLEADPATKWRLWIGSTPPNVGVDPVTLEADVAGDTIMFDASTYAAGTWHIALLLFRAVDSMSGIPATTTCVIAAAPTEPTPVHSGFEEGQF